MVTLGSFAVAFDGDRWTCASGIMETSVSGLFAAVRIKCVADNGDHSRFILFSGKTAEMFHRRIVSNVK